MLVKLSEFDSLEDLFNAQLEEFDLPCLDALVVEHEVVVDGRLALLALEDTALEEALPAWAGSEELRGDGATIPAVNDDSLVA